MPRVETTGRLAGPFIWDCLAQVSFQGSSSYLVQLPWTEGNSFKLPEPRGGSHSPSAHWEINVMFRQPQYLAITLVVSHFPQYSHIPYHKKTQIPYLNTVIKLPTSNDSWDRAVSHLLKRLIQREQISAPKSFLKFILDVLTLGGILLISITSFWVIRNQLSWVYTFHTLIKKYPVPPDFLRFSQNKHSFQLSS